MLQDVLSSVLVLLLSWVAGQVTLGRKEMRRDRRINRRRFALQQQQLDDHEERIDDLEGDDYGTEAEGGNA